MSQGPINVHEMEHLDSNDRGIEAVQKGQDPQGFYMSRSELHPTFANDRIVAASEVGGDPDDPAVLRKYADRLAKHYLKAPPMEALA